MWGSFHGATGLERTDRPITPIPGVESIRLLHLSQISLQLIANTRLLYSAWRDFIISFPFKQSIITIKSVANVTQGFFHKNNF